MLEHVCRRYHFVVVGYVVMPEHVHLLLSEPERGNPSTVMQAVKQGFARRILGRLRSQATAERRCQCDGEDHIWQRRFYDFVLWTARENARKSCTTSIRIRWHGAWSRSRNNGGGAVPGLHHIVERRTGIRQVVQEILLPRFRIVPIFPVLEQNACVYPFGNAPADNSQPRRSFALLSPTIPFMVCPRMPKSLRKAIHSDQEVVMAEAVACLHRPELKERAGRNRTVFLNDEDRTRLHPKLLSP